MSIANPENYLADIVAILRGDTDDKRFLNIVCHGHSTILCGFLIEWQRASTQRAAVAHPA